MEAPYTASESRITSEPVQTAIYEARTGAKQAVRRLEKDVATLKGICGVLFVAFIGLVLILVIKFSGLNNYAEEVNALARGAYLDIYNLQQDQIHIYYENEALWDHVYDLTYRLNQLEDAGGIETLPQEEKPEVPDPNTSAYVTAWCDSGEPKWLPESGNPSTFTVETINGDCEAIVDIGGPEISFEACVAPSGKDLKPLEEHEGTEGGFKYLVAGCPDPNSSLYEQLLAVRLNGVVIWTAEPVATEASEKTAQTQSPTPTTTEPTKPAYVPIQTPQGYTVKTMDVEYPGEWEVDFRSKYVENPSTRRPSEYGGWYEGQFFQVATCSEEDLQRVKTALINASLRGNSVVFEYIGTAKRFLVSVVENGTAVWKVCDSWMEKEARGKDW